MNRRMDRRGQQGRRQLGRVGVDRMGHVPRGATANHSQQALMYSQLASPPLDQLNAYMELTRQGILQGSALRGTNIPALGPAIPQSAIPLLSSGQGFYTVESLQGATGVPQGVLPPPYPHLVGPEGSRVMGYGNPGLRQGYDSGMSNMHMLMNPMQGREMLANGHPHPGSPMVAITSRPEQGLLGHMFVNGPPQQPHLHHVPLGFHPGRPSSGPGPLHGWPQERDHGEGWGWDRGGGRDMKGDWNHRHWDGHRESRQVEKFYPHGKKTRGKRNEQPFVPAKQPFVPAKQAIVPPSDKKRKFPNGLGPGGPGWCSLCELECNTAEMLQQHREGKRHKRHLQKIESEPEGGKEKTNSSNSSVRVVISEGDVSTGPVQQTEAGANGADKMTADAESEDKLKTFSSPKRDAGTVSPELSTTSEVEQSSKPGELGGRVSCEDSMSTEEDATTVSDKCCITGDASQPDDVKDTSGDVKNDFILNEQVNTLGDAEQLNEEKIQEHKNGVNACSEAGSRKPDGEATDVNVEQAAML